VLEGFGLTIVDRVPFEIAANDVNARYLATKRDRMGHELTGDVVVHSTGVGDLSRTLRPGGDADVRWGLASAPPDDTAHYLRDDERARLGERRRLDVADRDDRPPPVPGAAHATPDLEKDSA
jgi:hypothetical protein